MCVHVYIYVHMHVYTMSLLAIGCISKEFIYMQEIQHPTITSDKKKIKKSISLADLPFLSLSLRSKPALAQSSWRVKQGLWSFAELGISTVHRAGLTVLLEGARGASTIGMPLPLAALPVELHLGISEGLASIITQSLAP